MTMSFVDIRVARRWVLVPIMDGLPVCSTGLTVTRSGVGDLFEPAKMTDAKLSEMRVRLGKPIQVTAQLAWQEGYKGQWAFIHPIPTMARFPTGELIVTYSLVADTNENPTYNTAFQISRDGGRTWGHRYDTIPDHQGWIYVPQEPDALMAIPAHMYQRDANDSRNFHASYNRFERGGGRVIMEPSGVRVVDWPWPVEVFPSTIPRTNWISRLKFDGSALTIGGQLLATGYVSKKGGLMSNFLLASQDGGRTWRYFSTIADPSIMPASPQKGAEGPSETAVIQLAGGDLMAVFRVGSGRAWNLRRCYSKDGGRTWTKAESISPYSVEPSMLRMKNEIIALSTGRPGIRLWLSTDPRGTTWQDVDIAEHHNRWAPNSSYRIGSYGEDRTQTSSYTELVEVAPNRLLLVYDRGAKPIPVDENDLTRIFV